MGKFLFATNQGADHLGKHKPDETFYALNCLNRLLFVGGGADIKFSEVGDGIGGKSVWMDANKMTLNRITDWRNDKQAFVMFMLHDGRFLEE